MSLRFEIKPYVDGLGMVNPYIVPTGMIRGSDNGTMFSSEYIIMLTKRDEELTRDIEDWEILMDKTSIVPGLTARAPGDTSGDAPDNIIARLAAAKVLKSPVTAKDMLNYGYQNFGFFNASNPGHIRNKNGKIDWSFFLWRQPQLYVACLTASNALKWRHAPFVVVTALIIGFSCLTAPLNDSDSRRLNWLLIQAIGNDSVLCRIGAWFWKRRLFKHYPKGMLDVYNLYYKESGVHPFTKYMVIY